MKTDPFTVTGGQWQGVRKSRHRERVLMIKTYQYYVIAFVLSLAFFGVVFGLSAVSLENRTGDTQLAISAEIEDKTLQIKWFEREFYLDFSFVPPYELIRERGAEIGYFLAPPPVRLFTSFIQLGTSYGLFDEGIMKNWREAEGASDSTKMKDQ